MPDYQKMYVRLFNKVTDAIVELQQAQRDMEQLYMESADAGLPVREKSTASRRIKMLPLSGKQNESTAALRLVCAADDAVISAGGKDIYQHIKQGENQVADSGHGDEQAGIRQAEQGQQL